MKPKFLTKSRFKLGMECPAKLYYTDKEEYGNAKAEDPFMKALSEGGFQIGALARAYQPEGIDLSELTEEAALKRTKALLEQEQVTIFEAAISFKNLLIRIDILKKNGDCLELIEVKAKSFDSQVEEPFFNKNKTIKSGWKQHLFDVSFQYFVLQNACHWLKINSYLMCVDKYAKCPTDLLNQKFRIVKDSTERKKVIVSEDLTEEDLCEKLLIKVPVQDYVDHILEAENKDTYGELPLSQLIQLFSDSYTNDEKIEIHPHKGCNNCEFKCSEEDEEKGLKSGFKECWSNAFGWGESDFHDATILEIWSFRKKDKLIEDLRPKINDLEEDDISPSPDGKPGLSTKERQWLQVEKVQNCDSSIYLDKEGLRREFESWTYPLHFIDFETATVAIPFNKGRTPYEAIAFQFSHHTVSSDGQIEHKSEYLNTTPGEFPNYEFLRSFKDALSEDDGSIFRYSNHENTYLNHIYDQLISDPNPPGDKEELIQFIKSVTHSGSSSATGWRGERDMVDLWELVKRYYYDPYTRGSNSIKHVLPAILNSSKFLQEKYSKPIYGSANGIRSKNFTDWQWIKKEGDKVVDPYKLLPKMFEDISDEEFELLSDHDELNNGGAALAAYSKMQFSEMSDFERKELEKALLKYCELDTFAMVLIYEGWKDLLSI